jgi:4-diphosphocytidyl-2-C-methyl-D-erythritol kinase
VDKVKIKSPAKINLGLRVVGKRPDGYHNIETVLHEINLYDEIEISLSTGRVELITNSPDVPTGNENLCIKAARLFFERFDIKTSVKIYLKKNIPVGAGLGGGSSDAVGVLKGLNKLFGIDAGDDVMHEIASQLGSDAPFFVRGGTAYATGRGDILEYFKFEIPYDVVLIYPGINISTSWAYKNVKPGKYICRKNLRDTLIKNIDKPDVLRIELKNDFEEVVFKNYPEIADIKRKLYNAGALFALMSGSGSSVFGFFDKPISKEKLGAIISIFNGMSVLLV